MGETEAVDFSIPYKLSVPAVRMYEVLIGGKRMGELKGLKYLGTIQCKHGERDGEIKQVS